MDSIVSRSIFIKLEVHTNDACFSFLLEAPCLTFSILN